MSINSNQNWFQRHAVVFVIIAAVIIVGLGGAVAYLLLGKHSTAAQSANNSSQPATSSSTSATTYKLAACKSGSTQTIGNASYTVGVDIAPGNYKIDSQAADIGWTNFDVFNSQADYTKSKAGDNNVTDNSFQATNSADSAVAPAPSYTKLSDGQYMVVAADPATFTCQ